jgi:hypothetical protein
LVGSDYRRRRRWTARCLKQALRAYRQRRWAWEQALRGDEQAGQDRH